MNLPTRQRERSIAATIAVILIAVSIVVGLLVSVDLAGWIALMGTLFVLAFVQFANWLTSQPRRPR